MSCLPDPDDGWTLQDFYRAWLFAFALGVAIVALLLPIMALLAAMVWLS